MTRPTAFSTAPTPLFSLPRIPYHFTITPYPLNCQGLQAHSCLASSPQRMKRRFDADRGNRGARNSLNPSSDQIPPSSAVGDQPLHPGTAQNIHLHQHGGAGYVYPEAGSPEERDSGPESIDGRVLKRMRLIKLDSMSPPADVPQSPQSGSSRLSPTILDHEQGSFGTGLVKRISPIKISTRSTIPLNNVEPSTLEQVSNPVENVVYSGMNVLLHQIHASRFGIPSEGDLGNHSLYHQQQQEQRRASQHQQGQEQLYHHQIHHRHQQQQHQHEQQQQQQQQQLRPEQLQQEQYQARVNNGIPTTAWHQPPTHTFRPVDEDDEMTDMDEQMASGATGENLVAFSPFQAQAPGYAMTQLQHQQYQQHPFVQPSTPSNHPVSAQPPQQQQHQTYQLQGPNLYEDINAQLRAAFLARAGMEQRYQ